jgi:hypothetical protein
MREQLCDYCSTYIPSNDFRYHYISCKNYYENLTESTRLFSNNQIPSGNNLTEFVRDHFHVERRGPNSSRARSIQPRSLHNSPPNRNAFERIYSSSYGPSRSQFQLETSFFPELTPVYVGVKNIKDHLIKVTQDEIKDKNCSICLDDFINYNKVSKLVCEHIFCSNCIKKWLQINKKCPLCKHQLEN